MRHFPRVKACVMTNGLEDALLLSILIDHHPLSYRSYLTPFAYMIRRIGR